MKKATRNILLAVCFAAVILPMLAGKPSAADKRKAEYAFMEAISKKEAGDIDAAYALLRHDNRRGSRLRNGPDENQHD